MNDTPDVGAPGTPDDFASVCDRYDDYARRNADLLPRNRDALFQALANAGIASVLVGFDGGGDSGQIESVDAHDANGPASLPTGSIERFSAPWDPGEPDSRMIEVATAIEELAYDMLRNTHCGWENNDGAFGEFTFDVAAGVVRLEFHERYVATETYHHEL